MLRSAHRAGLAGVGAVTIVDDRKETFGSFKLVRQIAKGGMAEIFLAVEQGIEGIERRVVVKRILPEMTQSDDFITMFTDEARLTSQLSHPNIAHIYSFGEVDGLYYIAMEYVDGVTVSRLVRESGGALPLSVALRVASDVCAGLHYAHELEDSKGRNLGVIHRDVSPSNIMVSRTGEAKLIDFGVARASTQVHVTGVKQVKGKLAYMSPELLRGMTIDRRADVFAAGVVFYEMMTGARLFRRVSEAATVTAIAYDDPPSVESFGLDPAIDVVIGRALQKDPASRYQTAGEMQHALEQLISELGVTASGYVVGRFMADRRAAKKANAKLGRANTGRIDEADARAAIALAEEGDDGSNIDIEVAMPVSTSAGSLPSFSEPSAPSATGRERRRRGVVFAIVALVVLALLAGTLVLGIRLGSLGQQGPQQAAAAPASPPATAPSPAADASIQGAVADAMEPPAADGGPSKGEGDGDGGGLVARNADAGPDAEAVPAGKRPIKAAQRGFGTLYLDTEPWSRVRVGGRSLGSTPVMGAKLAAGLHRLRLVDADGRRHSRRVRIRPDQPTKAFFRLNR